jgi:NTP pyrophosphatase (non-canonical NTP hydrolase)
MGGITLPEEREPYIVNRESAQSASPFRSPTEIMLAATEELGEVAQEVALLERIGTKATWEKQGDVGRLGIEITHTINCLLVLANHYSIDLGIRTDHVVKGGDA